MSDDLPPCPMCDDDGTVVHLGNGYTCHDCGTMFHVGGGATTVHGPRPGYHEEEP